MELVMHFFLVTFTSCFPYILFNENTLICNTFNNNDFEKDILVQLSKIMINGLLLSFAHW